MSSIHQLEVSIDLLQDRILLSIYTQDLAEFRFWLTRRFIKILWQALTHLLKADQKTDMEHERENQQIAQQFEREQSQRRPSADKFANKMTKMPMGPDPILLSRVTGKIISPGQALLILEDEKQHHFEINADSKILLSLCKLLNETVKKADWDLVL